MKQIKTFEQHLREIHNNTLGKTITYTETVKCVFLSVPNTRLCTTTKNVAVQVFKAFYYLSFYVIVL